MSSSEKLDFLHVLDIAHVFLFTLWYSLCVSRLTPPCRWSFIFYLPMTMLQFIHYVFKVLDNFTMWYRLEKLEKLQMAAA